MNPLPADLAEFTGLSLEEVQARLDRRGPHHHAREWGFYAPASPREVRWFYRHSVQYLFSNAVHTIPPPLITWTKPGDRVLDFGGGSGNTVLALATLGRHPTYLDTSIIQTAFVRWRAARYGVPIEFEVKSPYDVVNADDVLEHVTPEDLEPTLTYLRGCLKVGGYLIESSSFGPTEKDPMHYDCNGFDSIVEKSGFSLKSPDRPTRVWTAG